MAGVFEIFENPYNLVRITPPWLKLRVTSRERAVMREGAGIEYRIRWLGIPIGWKTVITEYQPPLGLLTSGTRAVQARATHAHVSSANAAGHEDRHAPLKNYCKGLLLPGERKSIEAMAARLDPETVQPLRQSLHHLLAKAPWSDETLLEEVRHHVLPAMRKQGPVVAWIVDDTGFPKKGWESHFSTADK